MIRRTRLDPGGWQAVAASPAPALIGLWADAQEVHALLDGPVLVSVPVQDGAYPAFSVRRPEAAGFERAIRDLWGHWAEGGDGRPWFPAGEWPVVHPMSARPQARTGRAEPPDPGEVPEDRHVMVSGPVRGGLCEPVVLRAVTDGQVIERAEVEAGYAHTGTLLLMRGRTPRAASGLVARLQAEATVAHGIAFARAAEDACGAVVPPRGAALRSAMAAVETAATLVAEVPGVAGGGTMRWGMVVDGVRRAAGMAFGHRLMMDCVVPGGVLADVTPDGVAMLRRALDDAKECGVAVDAIRTARDGLGDLPPGELSVTLPASSGEGLGHATTPRGSIWHWVRLEGGVIVDAFACDPAWRAWPGFVRGLAGQSAELDLFRGGDGPATSLVPRVSGMDL